MQSFDVRSDKNSIYIAAHIDEAMKRWSFKKRCRIVGGLVCNGSIGRKRFVGEGGAGEVRGSLLPGSKLLKSNADPEIFL